MEPTQGQPTVYRLDREKHLVLEYSTHKFSVEASTLGLPPGLLPSSIETDLGNGRPFQLMRFTADGGGVYNQEFGCISLRVLND
jgi:hypothetical protein